MIFIIILFLVVHFHNLNSYNHNASDHVSSSAVVYSKFVELYKMCRQEKDRLKLHHTYGVDVLYTSNVAFLLGKHAVGLNEFIRLTA